MTTTIEDSVEPRQKLTTNRVLGAGEAKECTHCHKPVPRNYFAYNDHGHDIPFCALETCYALRQLEF